MKLTAFIIAATLLTGSLTYTAPTYANEEVVIVYDASGSMWDKLMVLAK